MDQQFPGPPRKKNKKIQPEVMLKRCFNKCKKQIIIHQKKMINGNNEYLAKLT